jgi:methyl-accepting chemotaxis protein
MLFLNKIRKLSIKQRLISLIFVNILSFIGLGISGLSFIFYFESKSQKLEEIVDLTRDTQVNFKKQIQEWKNILLRGETDLEKHKSLYEDYGKKVDENLSSLKSRLASFPDLEAKLFLLLEERKIISEKYSKAISLYDSKNPFVSLKNLDALVKGKDKKFTADLDSLTKEIKVFAQTENKRAISINQITTFSILIIGLFYCIVISILTLRSLNIPIQESIKIIREISRGNLAYRSNIINKDEISNILSSINSMAEKISNLLSILKFNLQKNNSIANELSDLANDYQRISETVNISIGKEITSVDSLVKVTDSTDRIAKNIFQNTSQIHTRIENIEDTQRVFSNSLNSLVSVNVNSFNEIKRGMESIQSLNDLIYKAKDSFKKITSITYLIQSIAKQTNLLSLNASIEAARAGDAGLGFAIVADNIYRLAEESLSKVQEINESVQLTDSAISGAVSASVNVEKLFNSLLSNAGKTEASANEFGETMKTQNNLIKEIATEMKDFQTISQMLESGLNEERLFIKSIKQEIENISEKSVETNDKAFEVKARIASLLESMNKINDSMEFFSLDKNS